MACLASTSSVPMTVDHPVDLISGFHLPPLHPPLPSSDPPPPLSTPVLFEPLDFLSDLPRKLNNLLSFKLSFSCSTAATIFKVVDIFDCNCCMVCME
ncbi:hypothetical protein F3Y22_tig00111366pilonHSYRG00066 [Hibiscus syriacus]|uniref:Uncharacterized protein n=1 Tax=Hibiscus syriacus TaxID=106335 RepID=A0A6A2YN93_HIBSY|nr:hypothetical protein F3Y22_tig00111366pilonHSYRG00066 [Hibiscus syriacus]